MLRRPLVLLAMDPPMASAVGLNVMRWELASAAWLGLVIGLTVRTGGMIYTFGLLVLPTLAAQQACHTVTAMLIVAPLVALVAAIAGFVIANHYDQPPAHVTVALLAASTPLAGLAARLRRRVAA